MNEKEFLDYAFNQLSENRQELMKEVLAKRTNHVTVILEDFYQPHNFSAVLRSCDIFGINKVNIIENKNRYQSNPKVNMGSEKWVDIKKFNQLENNTEACINQLKKDGYKIIAAHPHESKKSLHDVNLDQKTAILFGTEKAGVSDIAMEHVDEFMAIPMYGFTESFNVSVAAALTLSHVRHVLNDSDINWQLNEEDKNQVLDRWLSKCINGYSKLKTQYSQRF